MNFSPIGINPYNKPSFTGQKVKISGGCFGNPQERVIIPSTSRVEDIKMVTDLADKFDQVPEKELFNMYSMNRGYIFAGNRNSKIEFTLNIKPGPSGQLEDVEIKSISNVIERDTQDRPPSAIEHRISEEELKEMPELEKPLKKIIKKIAADPGLMNDDNCLPD